LTDFWKIGAVAGLIAGIVSGIVVIIVKVIQSLGFDLGIAALVVTPIVPFLVDASVEIVYSLIFGVFLGVIYCKIYNVIPRKAAVKALLFGFFLFMMFDLRFATIYTANAGYPLVIASIFFGFYYWLSFSIILGISYEFLRRRYYISKEEPQIIQYSMMGALLPSAIAALLGGMATFVTILIAVSTGFWEYSSFVHVLPESSMRSVSFSSPFEVVTELSHTVRASASGQLSDIDFLISRFGLQTYFHFVWCTIFGLFFAKVYNLIPRKGVIKGLVYGLIGLIITEGRVIGYYIVQAFYFEEFGWHEMAHIIRFEGEQMALLGSTVWIVFGIVLGLLYRKPSE
jgi:hypothetical protein